MVLKITDTQTPRLGLPATGRWQTRLLHPLPALQCQCRRTASSDGPSGVTQLIQAGDHSHSIINKPRKSAWLKGLALIDIGPYRRFYRQGNTPFPGAGLRGIGSSSISFNHTEQGAELHPLASRCDSAYESFFRPIMRCDAEPKWLPLQRKT